MAKPNFGVVGMLEEAVIFDDRGLPVVLFFLFGVGIGGGFPLQYVGPFQLEGEVGVVVLASAVDGGAWLTWQIVRNHG